MPKSKSIIDAFLPQQPLEPTDPRDDAAAEQWATAMTVLSLVSEGLTVDMAVDEFAAGSSLSRPEIVAAVRATLRELLGELS